MLSRGAARQLHCLSFNPFRIPVIDSNMADDGMTAGELRQRYARGGSAKDDELTAAQLRARHAIPSNQKDFSTRQSEKEKSQTMMLMAGVGVAVMVIVIVVYFSMKS